MIEILETLPRFSTVEADNTTRKTNMSNDGEKKTKRNWKLIKLPLFYSLRIFPRFR